MDVRGCKSSVPLTISGGSAVNVQVESMVNIPCNNSPQGEISVSASGGNPGYTYLWNTGDSTATISGLTTTGTYTVTASDRSGCTGVASATLQYSSPPLISVSSVDVTNCYGAMNGSASVDNITGGLPPYAVNWSNGATTNSITNIGGGTYIVIVSDANFCQSVDTIIVNQPNQILLNLNTTAPSCNGNNDGSASVNPTGGASGFTVGWSTSSAADTITSLAAGNYSVTVTDANSCTVDSSFAIVAPAMLMDTVTGTNDLCAGGTSGSAQATVTGGTGAYSYQWNDPANSTTSSVSNLPAGSYQVTITDSRNCQTTSSITITAPSALSATASGQDATTGQSNGAATIDNITGGTAPYSVHWSTGATTTTIVNLAAGTYYAVVTDNNGCSTTDTVVVRQVTGITQQLEQIPFSVYPNPAQSQITVQLGSLNAGTTLSIKNVLGEEFMTKTITSLQTVLTLTDFAGGVYFVEVKQGDKKTVKEIVVTK
jgi:hypothetical protein